MLTGNSFRQTNAFAMQLGVVFAMTWIVGFACLIGGFSHPLLHFLYLLILLSTPFTGIFIAKHFEKQVRQDGPVYYGRAYLFSFLLYFYASAILAIVAFLYFKYMDGGAFMEANIAYLSTPEASKMMQTPEMQQELQMLFPGEGMKGMIKLLRSVTPIMIVANIVDFNLLANIIISFPTAYFSQTKHV